MKRRGPGTVRPANNAGRFHVSIFWNSALAMANFTWSKQPTGIERLSFRFNHMFNLMSWQFTRKAWFPGSGNLSNREETSEASLNTEAIAVPVVEITGGARGSMEERGRTWHLADSTRRLNSAKKSAPRMGRSTAARRNGNSKRRLPNCRGITLEP